MQQLRDGPESLDRNREAENCGRISGSVAWRSSRNELGSGAARANALKGGPEAQNGEGSVRHLSSVKQHKRVNRISVRAGALIDRVTFFALDNEMLCQEGGGGGSECDDFVLDADEHIVKIIQKYGNSLDSITFCTNKGRTKKYGGNGGSSTKEFISKEGEMIVGLTRKKEGFCPIIEKVEFAPTHEQNYSGANESKTTL